jgi:hypothetical protein
VATFGVQVVHGGLGLPRWIYVSQAEGEYIVHVLAFGLADRNRMPVMTRQSEAGSASLLAPSLDKRRRSSEHDPLRRLLARPR